jgi:hypothetical protein
MIKKKQFSFLSYSGKHILKLKHNFGARKTDKEKGRILQVKKGELK